MSLKFLAVGKSVAGLKGDKSPYALRKENQLPRFGSSPRFANKPEEEQTMVQTDFLHEQPVVGVAEGTICSIEQVKEESLFAPAPPAAPPNVFSAQPQQMPVKRSWFARLFRWKWFHAQPSKADLVQSELRLDKVRVMRNDLADSDLRLVLKKKKKKSVFSSHQENNGIARQGWSELSARLFEIGQK